MLSDIEADNLVAVVGQDDITNSSRNVAEGTINMSMAATPSAWLCRKRRQVRRWGVRPAQHVLGDGGRTDLNPEFEQLAVNPRRSPERVGNAHLADQFAVSLFTGCRPARDRQLQ